MKIYFNLFKLSIYRYIVDLMSDHLNWIYRKTKFSKRMCFIIRVLQSIVIIISLCIFFYKR